MKMTTPIIGILAATFVAVIAALTFLTYNGSDIQPIIYFVGAVIGGAFPATLTSKTLGEVKTNTNGTLSKVMEQNSLLSESNQALREYIANMNQVGEIPADIPGAGE